MCPWRTQPGKATVTDRRRSGKENRRSGVCLPLPEVRGRPMSATGAGLHPTRHWAIPHRREILPAEARQVAAVGRMCTVLVSSTSPATGVSWGRSGTLILKTLTSLQRPTATFMLPIHAPKQ